MAWQDEMTVLLRIMVSDLDTPQTYSDDRVQTILTGAAYQVARELTFSQVFTIVLSQETITPDPTATATVDDSFVNLTCLKAACLIERGAAVLAVKQGIYVKDGASAVDLRDRASAQLRALGINWCKAYENAKLEYQAGQVRVAGAAVMTPFRTQAWGGNEFPLAMPRTDWWLGR